MVCLALEGCVVVDDFALPVLDVQLLHALLFLERLYRHLLAVWQICPIVVYARLRSVRLNIASLWHLYIFRLSELLYIQIEHVQIVRVIIVPILLRLCRRLRLFPLHCFVLIVRVIFLLKHLFLNVLCCLL